MAPYQPIGTGYQPIGTGYNRAKGEYGFTGVLENIKNNNLFQGEFNNRTATQVRAGGAGYSGDVSRLQLTPEAPRTWGASARPTSQTGVSGSAAAPMSTSPMSTLPRSTNPLLAGLGGQQPNAASLLTTPPLDAYDQLRDTNNNGIIDPWEM